MSDTVIRVENLGKKYIIGQQQQERYTTLRDVLANRAKGLFQGKRLQAQASEEFWALKDVSFEIKQGDRVGIIGRNGAGKSTLLKILSRITEPTTGSIQIKGRVASLLEVGTGFHPELTGRENIFLNGAILGMGKAEIRRKFDEIVAFAEVEKFLDTPVKRYSSGMYVRLAFAVAAHLEPEILVVDEVLAVGDAQFQKKCLGKMEDVGKAGHTVLFVSHNMTLVNHLCNQCIFLKDGCIEKQGLTQSVIQNYLSQQTSSKSLATRNKILLSDPDIDILQFFPSNTAGERKETFKTSEAICFTIHFNLKRKLNGLRIGIDFLTQNEEVLFRSFNDDLRQSMFYVGKQKALCIIHPNLLKPGRYEGRLKIGLHNVRWFFNEAAGEYLEVEHVDGVNSLYGDYRPGFVMPGLDWKIEQEGEVVYDSHL